MLLLVAALILFGQSSALNKNGYVNRSEAVWNRNIKTEYCFQCLGMLVVFKSKAFL